ncbi:MULTISPECIES: DUF6296 family protein [unclassified Streptomyces]|uniref:DUF6296 family protein n=1 Tax=unclassified Streptomyces TaxID=2593676 RepID=UPI001BE7DC49|nr:MULTISPECIES: DUF6296 family protein [unclassified Streptomyces]MBT2406182.1 hypothetical protein [Streptomyces sp. ISL-21]MBT2459534.1 hypothetical protein [Streptomyces sp. ISL-86]MBT2609240.1 hypothetical protein [Streptomyces sp. ISL-87]
MSEDRYELVFDGAEPGAEAGDSVVVSRTEQTGPGGHPVYADATGIVRAEISDQGEVRMLASGGHQTLTHPVQARRPASP